jgi:hypothetical protein
MDVYDAEILQKSRKYEIDQFETGPIVDIRELMKFHDNDPEFAKCLPAR